MTVTSVTKTKKRNRSSLAVLSTFFHTDKIKLIEEYIHSSRERLQRSVYTYRESFGRTRTGSNRPRIRDIKYVYF